MEQEMPSNTVNAWPLTAKRLAALRTSMIGALL